LDRHDLCIVVRTVRHRLVIDLPPPVPAAGTAVHAEAQIIVADPVVVPASRLGRALSLKVTAPAVGRNLPVVVLTHGNRLSREDYRPLVEWWARAGFVVIQPDHEDASTDGYWPASISSSMWRTRVADVSRAMDAIPVIAATVPGLAGRVDRTRIAVAGHSLGGLTAEMIGGAALRAPVDGQPPIYPDRRVRAVLLLAPPGRYGDLTPQWRDRAPYLDVDFATMKGPVFVVAGGSDDGLPLSDRGAGWREDAYRLAPRGTACLVVIPGVAHYLGGINGPGMKPDGDATPARLAFVREATTRFLRAALVKPDPGFKPWLAGLAASKAAVEAGCN
jgi:dienelactone hydrolase